MVHASKGALVGTLAVAIACVALPAWAEPAPSPDEIPLDDSHKATAQQLFLAGMDALDDGDLETACRDFAESQRLDPAIGTRFNLADCYEQRGQLASAWVNYVGVADAAERLGQMDRAQFARARADALQPRLSHLRIDVEEPVAGLHLTRDAVEVGRAQWSMRVPVICSGATYPNVPITVPRLVIVVTREDLERPKSIMRIFWDSSSIIFPVLISR